MERGPKVGTGRGSLVRYALSMWRNFEMSLDIIFFCLHRQRNQRRSVCTVVCISLRRKSKIQFAKHNCVAFSAQKSTEFLRLEFTTRRIDLVSIESLGETPILIICMYVYMYRGSTYDHKGLNDSKTRGFPPRLLPVRASVGVTGLDLTRDYSDKILSAKGGAPTNRPPYKRT